ncbi:T-cell activation Rho GTPase activating protein, putative [Entamoeba invadens IP1]|uniref:T-cell activation Rho GTPase activating protein, putative n=1 Tax=Entamoeba invadens IP1 TaxID=370355 RepID=UPI0002C3D691|nr:T-cell activation Rho GTPase activating protein, putative [Entamoeba invadens IP1]ELP93990.1 T-cell activation Rho GTPase activating protein, putative [Entamoeba invadens IP1]|eukprot:XP_004260761.1 T-cell activation Rho GTPase activating protein, putative [Entamoeba invadens IP1]
MQWNQTISVERNIKDRLADLRTIELLWQEEQTLATRVVLLLSTTQQELNKHAEFLTKLPPFSNALLDKKVTEQFIGAFRFIANNFELMTDTIKAASKTPNEMFMNINKLRASFASPTQGQEILFSQNQMFYNDQLLALPHYYLTLFKSFENLFSLGHSFFTDTPFTSTISSNLKTKAEQSKLFVYTQYTNKTIREILLSEKRTSEEMPCAVYRMLNVLYTNGWNTKGIFRESQNASVRRIEEICQRLSVTHFDEMPCDVVANVYKRFLRNIPGSIVNRKVTEKLLKVWSSYHRMERDETKLINELKTTLSSLEIENYFVLANTFKIAKMISDKSEINSMSAKNISVCLTTNLMSLCENDTFGDAETTNEYLGSIEIGEFIITNFAAIFPNFGGNFTEHQNLKIGLDEIISQIPESKRKTSRRKVKAKVTDRIFSDGKDEKKSQQKIVNNEICDDSVVINQATVKRNIKTMTNDNLITKTYEDPSPIKSQKRKKTDTMRNLLYIPQVDFNIVEFEKQQKKEKEEQQEIEDKCINPELSYRSIERLILGEELLDQPQNGLEDYLVISQKAIESEKQKLMDDMKKKEEEQNRINFENAKIVTGQVNENKRKESLTYFDGVLSSTYNATNPFFEDK